MQQDGCVGSAWLISQAAALQGWRCYGLSGFRVGVASGVA